MTHENFYKWEKKTFLVSSFEEEVKVRQGRKKKEY